MKVKFLKPDEYVKPEMNARVTFLSNGPPKKETTEKKFYMVPKSAIRDKGKRKGGLCRLEGVVQARPVTIAKEAGSDAFVSAGLTGNESIIIGDNLNQLKVGDGGNQPVARIMPAVAINNVTKKFRKEASEIVALNNTSLSIEAVPFCA